MLQQLPGTIWFLIRGFVTSVIGNLSLALISVALAVSLWLFVTDRENPTEAQTFPGAIPVEFVNVPNDLAVANASVTSVRVRVEAPQTELDNINAEDLEATVDLGGVSPGVTTLPVSVTSSKSRVRIIDVTPSRVDVTVENQRSKEVSVQVSLSGSPQQGFAAGNTSAEPTSVTVTGAQSLVELVDHVQAVVPISGARVDLAEDRIQLRPADSRGGEISRVVANPPTARVTVDIEQREFSLEFIVNPTIAGTPASGYNVASITVDPRIVTVTGPLEALQSIDAVRGLATEEISIADARTDVIAQVELTVPPGARVQGSPQVRVTVAIRPARGEATFLVVPQIRNVGNGLVVVPPPQSVSVTLSGDVPTLQGLTPESISVVADAQGLPAGLHALPLQITAPPGTAVVRSDPGELGIALVPRQ